MRVVATVLPFRVNEYVVDELIDWDRVPDDPMYRLTFPARDMLPEEEFDRVADALRREASSEELKRLAAGVRLRLNPHPAGQLSANVPKLDDEPVPGVQHKYRETVLVFPSHGQTCHAYCAYCFRWPQFVGMPGLKFATGRARRFLGYLARHREVTDVLFTGGDPAIMKTRRLADYVEPLLRPRYEHVRSIRFGTKAVAYWPHRFVSDPDADDLLRLFERVIASGKHLALMAHYSHARELSTPMARAAIRRIRATGAAIRTQAPIVRGVNDTPEAWAEMWSEQVRLGCIPYYMFVERDTGAMRSFSLPLARTLDIYRDAVRVLSGLGRTARGPVMSTGPGKVRISGTAVVAGERVFVLSMLQARDPELVGRPFFARYDPAAKWLTELRPAFGAERFPFEAETRGRDLGARVAPDRVPAGGRRRPEPGWSPAARPAARVRRGLRPPAETP